MTIRYCKKKKSASRVGLAIMLIATVLVSGCSDGGGGGKPPPATTKSSSTPSPNTPSPSTQPVKFEVSDITGAIPSNTFETEIQVTGLSKETQISASGAEYSINGSEFTGEKGLIAPGQVLRLKITPPKEYGATKAVELTIGSVSERFNVSTREMDGRPEKFSFAPITNQEPNTLVTSPSVEVTGITDGTTIQVSPGMSYSIDGMPFSKKAGTINAGQKLVVQMSSPNKFNALAKGAVTVGAFTATFTVGTKIKDTSPEKIVFSPIKNAEPGALLITKKFAIKGITDFVPVSIEGAKYAIDTGDFTDEKGIIHVDQSITLQIRSSEEYSIAKTAWVTIGGSTFELSVETMKEDREPDAMNLPAITNWPIATLAESPPISVKGLNTSTPVKASILGGMISRNGGEFKDQVEVANGDILRVSVQSSSDFGTEIKAVPIVGALSQIFSVTTLPIDDNPDPVSFGSIGPVTLATQIESNSVLITGINAAAKICVDNGVYAINADPYTQSCREVVSGDTVRMQVRSSKIFGTSNTAKLTIGKTIGTFTVTTIEKDVTPIAFAFIEVSDVAVDKIVTSNPVYIEGVNTRARICVDQGEYSINNGAFTKICGSVDEGDMVIVKMKSAGAFSTSKTAEVKIGTITELFTVSTNAEDMKPDPLIFTDQLDIEPGTLAVSNLVEISGINTTTEMCVSDGEYAIDGEGFKSGCSSIKNGSIVQLRGKSSKQFSGKQTVVARIGSTTGIFKLTTRKANTNPDPFTVDSVDHANPETEIISNAINIKGIEAPTKITIQDGFYSIDNGEYTDAAGHIENNQIVRVKKITKRHTGVDENTILTIGEVSADFKVTVRSLFFAADDGERGMEIWRTNGDELFTELVKDVGTAKKPLSNVKSLVSTSEKIYFSGYTLFEKQQYRVLMSYDIDTGTLLPATTHKSVKTNIKKHNDEVYFIGVSLKRPGSYELLVMRGGEAVPIHSYSCSASSDLDNFISAGEKIYFISCNDIYESDGTAAGTRLIEKAGGRVTRQLTHVDDALYFVADTTLKNYKYGIFRMDLSVNGSIKFIGGANTQTKLIASGDNLYQVSSKVLTKLNSSKSSFSSISEKYVNSIQPIDNGGVVYSGYREIGDTKIESWINYGCKECETEIKSISNRFVSNTIGDKTFISDYKELYLLKGGKLIPILDTNEKNINGVYVKEVDKQVLAFGSEDAYTIQYHSNGYPYAEALGVNDYERPEYYPPAAHENRVYYFHLFHELRFIGDDGDGGIVDTSNYNYDGISRSSAVSHNGVSYFLEGGRHPKKIYRTQGTAETTEAVVDLKHSRSRIVDMAVVNGNLYYSTQPHIDGSHEGFNSAIWKYSDNQAQNTLIVEKDNSGDIFNSVLLPTDEDLYYWIVNQDGMPEIWKYETEGDSSLVAELKLTTAGEDYRYRLSANMVNGQLILTNEYKNADGDWVADNYRLNANNKLEDINQGMPIFFNESILILNLDHEKKTILITAYDGMNENPTTYNPDAKGFIGVAEENLYLEHKGGLSVVRGDFTNQFKVIDWCDIKCNYYSPYKIGTIGKKLVFTHFKRGILANGDIWVTDGTKEGTEIILEYSEANINTFPVIKFFGSYEFDGALYFYASTLENGTELWRTDGTTDGTHMIKDIAPGTLNSRYN